MTDGEPYSPPQAVVLPELELRLRDDIWEAPPFILKRRAPTPPSEPDAICMDCGRGMFKRERFGRWGWPVGISEIPPLCNQCARHWSRGKGRPKDGNAGDIEVVVMGFAMSELLQGVAIRSKWEKKYA